MIQRPAMSGFLHSAKNVPQTRAPIIAPFFLSECIGRGVVFGRNFFGAILHAELHAKIGAKIGAKFCAQIGAFFGAFLVQKVAQSVLRPQGALSDGLCRKRLAGRL